jgi:hypothetical protein
VSETWNPVGTTLIQTDETPSGQDGDEPSEFDRFEDLASKLAQTPKSEVDEKRKES